MDQLGCPLCGEHHELTFHSFPPRWSIERDGERQRIRAGTILCKASRRAGRPYTKRILPEHLIWRSPFWSTVLVQLLEKKQDGDKGFTDRACDALGCIDPRTARKHIKAIRAAVNAKLPLLAALLATAPTIAEGPAFPPGMNAFAILCLLWDRYIAVIRDRCGSYVAHLFKAVLWLGSGIESWRIFNRSCIPIPDRPEYTAAS